MLRTIIYLTGVMLIGMSLSACTYVNNADSSFKHSLQSTQKKSGKDRAAYQICYRLRNRLVGVTNDPKTDVGWASPTAQAQIMKEYQRYDCAADIDVPHTRN